MRTNRLLISTLLVSLIWGCAEKTEKQSLHFYVAGHTTGALDDSIPGMYTPFITYMDKTFKDTTVDFAVFTGDIVYSGTPAAWDAVDQRVDKSPYKIYFAPGNQDLTDRDLYTKRYGSGTRHFEKANNLFIIWEVFSNGWNITDRQLEEFQRLAAKKKYDNIFIFTHEVIWYDLHRTPQIIPNSIDGKAETLDFYTKTLSVLSRRTTPVYLFAGDVGSRAIGSELTIHQYKNVRMLGSGMGGGEWDNIIDIHVVNGAAKVDIHYLKDHPPLTIDKNYVPVAP